MGKVYRQDRKTVQRIKARDIVPGDIVEVAGKLICLSPCANRIGFFAFASVLAAELACVACTCLSFGFGKAQAGCHMSLQNILI